ncbi:MAG: hypothetical protein IT244_13755 [Bacteroidia bacterium]|nr:hypothetical protein [Bacteroidia bacterium]
MKNFFLLPSILLLTSCGLFHRKAVPPVQLPKTYFNTQNIAPLRQSLVLDYLVGTAENETDFMVYPLTNSGYNFDYNLGGKKGSIHTSEWAMQNANSNLNYFKGGPDTLTNKCAVWLSRKVFEELRLTGKTRLDLGADGVGTFVVSGNSSSKVTLQDSNIVLPVVELKCDSLNYYISFVPDAAYPLIVTMKTKFKVDLLNITNREMDFDAFEPGPNCRLKYRMVEAGVNEYEIDLINKAWNDSFIRFSMHGHYTSSSYEYDFDYDILFQGDALLKPDFVLPIISALKGEMVYDNDNWLLLQTGEVDSVKRFGKGFLSVPHFSINPDDDPGAFENEEDRKQAQKEYDESFHTYFYLNKWGRLKEDKWYLTGADGEDKGLAVMSMASGDGDIQLSVLGRSKYPLMVYYNDGMLYEISLEYASQEPK